MSTQSGTVVAYQSEADRAIDQWIWHGGGWAWLLVAAVVAFAAYSLWPGNRQGKAK